MQIYNIGLSLHRFCLSILVKRISCMYLCGWTLTLTCICVGHFEELCFSRSATVFFSSTSRRSHRLGNASSLPQSSEGKPMACCSDHHVPESANRKRDKSSYYLYATDYNRGCQMDNPMMSSFYDNLNHFRNEQ